MKAIHQHLYALLLVSIVFVSCRKHFAEEKQFQEPGTSAAASNNNEEGFEGEGDIKIEEFRQNPYTVTNMAQALVQVRRKGLAPDNFQIIPQTHLYVKFKPRNMAQYEVLSSDSTLFLLDYPVEADVVEGVTGIMIRPCPIAYRPISIRPFRLITASMIPFLMNY